MFKQPFFQGGGGGVSLVEQRRHCDSSLLCANSLFGGHTPTPTHNKRQMPGGILCEGISVNIPQQLRCWWPCEVGALLNEWCRLISSTNIQER